MTRRTIATISISILLLVLMIWSFGSSAANNSQKGTSNASRSGDASEIFQDNNQEEVDADLGKHGSRIDREEYLRLRGEYVARKRGIEPGRPFNPELRVEAIQQMERQQQMRQAEPQRMERQQPQRQAEPQRMQPQPQRKFPANT